MYRFLALVLVAGAVVVGAAGMRWGWAWTGFPENGTFWAWLSLLALPLALVALPVWLKTRSRYSVAWRIGLSVATVLFLGIVVGGYVFAWPWVGFYGDETVQLWDWLTKLVQPAVIVLIPFWLRLGRAGGRQAAMIGGSGLAVFLVLVICGYAVPWEWTGFSDRRLWDWIGDFFVPFALPVALVLLDVEAAASTAGSKTTKPLAAGGARGGRARATGGRGVVMATAVLIAVILVLAVWSRASASQAGPPFVWRPLQGPAPGSVTGEAAAAYQDQIWVAGGMGRTVRVYNPATRRWHYGPSLPAPRRLGAMVSDGTRLYYIGGMKDGGEEIRGQRDVYRLDSPDGPWRRAPRLPDGLFSGAAAWDGHRILFAGGAHSDKPRNAESKVWVLGPRSWTSNMQLPNPREHLAAASDRSGDTWFVGGADVDAKTMSDEVDKVQGSKVTSMEPLTKPLAGLSAAWSLSSGVCAIAGSATRPDITNRPTKGVTCFGQHKWPDLPHPTSFPAAAVSGDSVYVVAGADMYVMRIVP